MASILKVDDLRGNTAAGNITITSEGGSATMQLQQGAIKAWSHLNCNTASAVTVEDSFNQSSASDDGVGKNTMNFTNSMSNDDFALLGAGSGQDGVEYNYVCSHGQATGSVTLRHMYGHSGLLDTERNGQAIAGDLA